MDKDSEESPPPSYSSLYTSQQGAPHSRDGSPQPRRRIPDAASYVSSSEPAPRAELMRSAAHQVLPPRTTYVSDPNMQSSDDGEAPMVAMPPVSSSWKDAVNGAKGQSEEVERETSFCVTGVPPSEQQVSHGPSGDGAAAEAPPTDTSFRAATAIRDPMVLDQFNGNESPYSSPRRKPMADPGAVQVTLSTEDEQDVDNGNAPEMEHVRHSVPDVEAAPDTERNDKSEVCTAWSNCCRRRSMRKVIVISCVVVPCVLMFLIMFPLSFIYVEYHQLALKRIRSTGYVDTTTVYQPGCYVLGPDMEFRYFQKTANFMEFKKLEVMTVDKLTFSMSFTFQYYFIEEKIGQVYNMFENEYEPAFRSIATSTIKNEAVKFSLNEFRKDRTWIEGHMHTTLRDRFLGKCTTCTQSYHVDIRYFQLGFIDTPDEVMERLLVRSVAAELTETEKFKLQYAVVNKETDRQVGLVINEASEILANATAHASYIRVLANVQYEMTKALAHTTGLKQLCEKMAITRGNDTIMLYYLKTINESPHIHMVPDVAYRSLWVQET